MYYIQDECEKSPLLLLGVLLRASLSLFNLMRPSHYYLEDGLEHGLLLLLYDEKVPYLYYIRGECKKSPLLLLCVLRPPH